MAHGPPAGFGSNIPRRHSPSSEKIVRSFVSCLESHTMSSFTVDGGTSSLGRLCGAENIFVLSTVWVRQSR